MLKTLPKSNITKRSFPVYKQWTVSNTQYPIISASAEMGLFDADTSTTQEGIYTHTLYKSIASKYYNQQANPFTIFGSINNIAEIQSERQLGDTIYVISLPQNLYGERIKPESVILSDEDNGTIYADDGMGSIVSSQPLYTLLSIDFETEEIVITERVNHTTHEVLNLDNLSSKERIDKIIESLL